MSLTDDQRRAAEELMQEMLAEGWEPEPELAEAVYAAFMTGQGRWKDLVISVDWESS